MTALGGALGWLRGPGRRRAWRRRVARRLLASACAVIALLTVLGMVRDPDAVLVPVLVASRPLEVGDRLTGGAVTVARYPAGLVPAGAFGSVSSAQGQVLAAPLGTGEPVTASRLSRSGLAAALPAGLVAVHVALADAGAAQMLRPGDRVDLVGPGAVVARATLVLRTGDLGAAGSEVVLPGAGPVGDGSGEPAGIVVAADPETARAIAQAPFDALGRPNLTPLLRSG